MGVRHFVLLKFKEGTDKPAVCEELSRALSVLPAKVRLPCKQPTLAVITRHAAVSWQIPEIKSYSFHADAGLDPARNHDYIVVADFADQAGYQVRSPSCSPSQWSPCC